MTKVFNRALETMILKNEQLEQEIELRNEEIKSLKGQLDIEINNRTNKIIFIAKCDVLVDDLLYNPEETRQVIDDEIVRYLSKEIIKEAKEKSLLKTWETEDSDNHTKTIHTKIMVHFYKQPSTQKWSLDI